MSLRGRVTLGTVLVFGVGLAVISVALNLLLAERLSADASSLLRNRADAQLTTLETVDGSLRVREVPNDAALDEHAWVFDADGRAVERSPATGKLAAAIERLKGVQTETETDPTEHVRLLARPIDGGGTVIVGVSMDPYRHTERIAVVGTGILCLFVLLGSALVARRAVGAALEPVSDMTARAAEWSENDLHRRFALGPPVDELTALAATLDGLLGRIDAALRHEQRFSAEMAHELRTPLSGVRAEVELALRDGRTDAERRAALQTVLAGTDRMAAVIETLLAAARSDTARGSSDAVAVARTVTQLVQPYERAIALRATVEPLTVRVGEDVIAGALHPLLENAVRHATHDVEVEVAPGADGGVVIAVSDDGAGIAPEDAERIFAPGVSGNGGAGLGLPLARRLARAAGGDVVAVPQRGGRLELRLPT
ncbi:ATP-binding protein [Solirubrobacter soli]|uniref:ATP-binding protein n=1 Tax=Solirubrobacter soli TaxID=363832 RepID=UPI0003F8FFA1|nr:ATP-binding protein [Solirubrobacter soli]